MQDIFMEFRTPWTIGYVSNRFLRFSIRCVLGIMRPPTICSVELNALMNIQ